MLGGKIFAKRRTPLALGFEQMTRLVRMNQTNKQKSVSTWIVESEWGTATTIYLFSVAMHNCTGCFLGKEAV